MNQKTHTNLTGKLLRVIVEFAARNLSYADLAQRLQASCGQVASHMASAPDTPENRKQAGHVIGIERWGVRRLRIALGESPVGDEYDGYRPAGSQALAALRGEFESTRADTLKLVEALRQAGVAETQTAPHNDMGNLSVRGWLFYLDSHATREASRVR